MTTTFIKYDTMYGLNRNTPWMSGTITKTKISITSSCKYFATKEAAQIYREELELKIK
jgi:hypothetical protein